MNRINIRVEHVKHSKCRADFLDRVKENEKLKSEAAKTKTRVVCKRQVCLLSHGFRSLPFICCCGGVYCFLSLVESDCSSLYLYYCSL